jgi:hypothetical protein
MGLFDRPEVKELFNYPLLEAIARRRTRRFPVGCNLEVGTTAYKSKNPPVGLSDIETAILCWAGAGVTGIIASDLHTPGMGNTFCSWVGKATAMPCSYPTIKLFFTNDDGVFLYDPKEATSVVEIDTEEDREKLMTYFKNDTVKVRDGRLKSAPEGVLNHMLWNTNKPGMTVFMPIVDFTVEYINLLLGAFQGEGYKMVDDIKGRPAGVGKWFDNGALNGPEVPMTSFEYFMYSACLAPAFLATQNLQLTAEAMGLGSIPIAGYTSIVMLGGTPAAPGLGFRFEEDKEGKPNCVGLDGFYETFCPPYKSMDDAVDEFVECKFGSCGMFGKDYDGPHPHKDRECTLPGYDQITPQTIQITKDYCNYVYDTYGRFPATFDAIAMPMWLQAHHVETDWYDNYQIEGLLNENHRTHMKKWHGTSSD